MAAQILWQFLLDMNSSEMILLETDISIVFLLSFFSHQQLFFCVVGRKEPVIHHPLLWRLMFESVFVVIICGGFAGASPLLDVGSVPFSMMHHNEDERSFINRLSMALKELMSLNKSKINMRDNTVNTYIDAELSLSIQDEPQEQNTKIRILLLLFDCELTHFKLEYLHAIPTSFYKDKEPLNAVKR
ncbi:hypothetical protein Tco_0806798 [Tanacetum coccineum]